MGGMTKDEAKDVTAKFTRVAVAVENFTILQEKMNTKLDDVIFATQKNTIFREGYENWSKIKITAIVGASLSLMIGVILIIIRNWDKVN